MTVTNEPEMIGVCDMTFTYPAGDNPAVRGLSFSVERGEIFGFLGPSGAGKSTTQKILIGLLHGYEGKVEVMGRALGSWGPDYYERVGVSFELPTTTRSLPPSRTSTSSARCTGRRPPIRGSFSTW